MNVEESIDALVHDWTEFCGSAEVTRELAEGIVLVNEDVGVSWLFSFLSGD